MGQNPCCCGGLCDFCREVRAEEEGRIAVILTLAGVGGTLTDLPLTCADTIDDDTADELEADDEPDELADPGDVNGLRLPLGNLVPWPNGGFGECLFATIEAELIDLDDGDTLFPGGIGDDNADYPYNPTTASICWTSVATPISCSSANSSLSIQAVAFTIKTTGGKRIVGFAVVQTDTDFDGVDLTIGQQQVVGFEILPAGKQTCDGFTCEIGLELGDLRWGVGDANGCNEDVSVEQAKTTPPTSVTLEFQVVPA